MIYVGSAEDTRYDQVLEEVDVGPIPIGVNKFVLTAGGERTTTECFSTDRRGRLGGVCGS